MYSPVKPDNNHCQQTLLLQSFCIGSRPYHTTIVFAMGEARILGQGQFGGRVRVIGGGGASNCKVGEFSKVGNQLLRGTARAGQGTARGSDALMGLIWNHDLKSLGWSFDFDFKSLAEWWSLILISNHFLVDFDFESTYFCQNQNHQEIDYYL